MIYVYDKIKHIYWELDYVNPIALSEMENDSSLIFIEETDEVYDKIQSIPNAFRRFIIIDDNKVSIDYSALKSDIVLQLQERKQERLAYIDAEISKITQEIALGDSVENQDDLKSQARTMIAEKEKWNNLQDNIELNDISNMTTYTEIVNEILKDVDPEFVDPATNKQINTI